MLGDSFFGREEEVSRIGSMPVTGGGVVSGIGVAPTNYPSSFWNSPKWPGTIRTTPLRTL
ncbi:MAG: hypothetical protein ACI9VS_003226, partial [Candidatus Binatia bacterium]